MTEYKTYCEEGEDCDYDDCACCGVCYECDNVVGLCKCVEESSELEEKKCIAVACSDCRHKTINIDQDEYDKRDKMGFVVYCDECEYKNKIIHNEIRKRIAHNVVGVFRPHTFELGKFHLFRLETIYKRFWRHFIIDITKITKCFITYKIQDISAGEELWTECKRKIFNPSHHRQSIKYPPRYDNINNINRLEISPYNGNLYRIVE